ncbi:MAG: 3-hydroxybutyryl-CoA dehydrogenase [Hyphococcus sp.]
MGGAIKSTGVVGAGQMGIGIAHVFAVAGYEVLLNDIDEARLKDALGVIDQNLRRQAAKGVIAETAPDEALARIHPAADLTALSECDLVIESATENQALKKEIFSALSQSLKPDAIMATNTSSISITGLAASTDRPEKFIGLHFMNPAPLMKLVEVIRGIATSRETFETTKALVDSLGKTMAVAEDFPAFIVNRILMPMINEAIYTLYEGVGSVEAIDTGMKLGANHPMGPLQLADFIGLDTCLAIMQVLYEGLADTKYRPCPLLVKYVEAGWLGKKTGRGFYDYSGPVPTPTR